MVSPWKTIEKAAGEAEAAARMLAAAQECWAPGISADAHRERLAARGITVADLRQAWPLLEQLRGHADGAQ